MVPTLLRLIATDILSRLEQFERGQVVACVAPGLVLTEQEREILRVCQAGPLCGKAIAARVGRRFNSAFRTQLAWLVRLGYLTDPREVGGYRQSNWTSAPDRR